MQQHNHSHQPIVSRLLRVIASSTHAKENKLDTIFNAAADELDRTRFEEGDRQLTLLSLALCSLLRPGFDTALGLIAEKLEGKDMFEHFKHLNSDIVKPSSNKKER